MNKKIILQFESGMELAQAYGEEYFDIRIRKIVTKKNLGVCKLALYKGYLFQRGIF